MKSVTSWCTLCEEPVKLRPDEIVVTRYPDRTAYEFDCPICETPMERPANERLVAVFLAMDITFIDAAPLPAPVRQAMDDLLTRCRQTASYDIESQFHDLLESGDTLDVWGLA